MADTRSSNQHAANHALKRALKRAQQLSDSRPASGDRTSWHHEAAHVGDLAVLALALQR
jgi:hypothetical protein